MGDQGAENNVLQKMEKRIEKKLKKGKTGKETVTGSHGIENVGRNEASEHEQRSQIEDIPEMSRNQRKNKEKKANKEVKDAEVVDMEKDSSHGQLISVHGEDGTEDARNREKRKKRKSKNEACSLPRYEVGKLKANEVLEKPVEEKVSKLKSGKAAMKEGKKQISMEIHNVGDIDRGYEDREQCGTFDDNIEGSVTEKVKAKKRKRGRTDGGYEDREQGGTFDDNIEGSFTEKVKVKKRKRRRTDGGYEDREQGGTFDDNIEGSVAEKVKAKKRKRGRTDGGYEDREQGGTFDDNIEGGVTEKVKAKKRKRQRTDGGYEDREQGGTFDDNIEGSVTEKVKVKKRKRGRTDSKDDYCIESQGNCAGAMESKIYDGSEENMTMENESKSKKMFESITENLNEDFSKKVKRKKKKAAEDKHNEGGDVEKHKRKNKKNKTYGNEIEEAKKGKNKKAKVGNDLDGPTPSKSNKKVSFSGQVEVFPLSDDSSTKIHDEENLVQGKRFTPEENEIVKAAVYRFIEDHDLGEDGLDMVLNSKKHPKLRGCWKEIAAAIPYRPYSAVYYRAQVIFRRSASRKWTQEEYDMILKHQELNGNEWKALADELGKHRWHVKDTWRRIKLRNMNKGQWSQKEYQNLFDLVNIDLQQKISEEKRSKHGMLRDNICWTAISDKLSTRAQANCCIKWYNQLTSPMVAQGLWADTDDYRMMRKLYVMDPGCMEDVDWDTLLDHRSGDLCRKRWNQMVMHIGSYGTKPFPEHVDLLAKRYCPELLEAREIWDNKPRVP